MPSSLKLQPVLVHPRIVSLFVNRMEHIFLMVSIKDSSNYIVLFIYSHFPNGKIYYKVSNSDSGKNMTSCFISKGEGPGELYFSKGSLLALLGQFHM